MTEIEAAEWLVKEGWQLAGQLLDETLIWADQIETPPPAPCTRLPRRDSSSPPIDGESTRAE